MYLAILIVKVINIRIFLFCPFFFFGRVGPFILQGTELVLAFDF